MLTLLESVFLIIVLVVTFYLISLFLNLGYYNEFHIPIAMANIRELKVHCSLKGCTCIMMLFHHHNVNVVKVIVKKEEDFMTNGHQEKTLSRF